MTGDVGTELSTRLAERCLHLVRIPSVTGQERELTDELERWARTLRPPLGQHVFRRGNGLVVGCLDPIKPTVALVGHTDTVPVPSDAAGARWEADRVVGTGASDMKAGLAVMQLLAENYLEASARYGLLLVFYDREEGPFVDNGLQPLLEARPDLARVALAVLLEPTDNAIQLGCVGGLQARVTFRGKAAHSARPWQGENAIHKAGPLLSALATRPARPVEVEGLVFRETLTVTMAQGGRATNVVPDSFVLQVNLRFAPVAPVSTAADRAVKELRDLCVGAELEVLDVAPAAPVVKDNLWLQDLLARARLPVQPKQAWTDVARLAGFGIPACNFGPGATAQAHQQGEWVSVEAMLQCYRALADWLAPS